MRVRDTPGKQNTSYQEYRRNLSALSYLDISDDPRMWQAMSPRSEDQQSAENETQICYTICQSWTSYELTCSIYFLGTPSTEEGLFKPRTRNFSMRESSTVNTTGMSFLLVTYAGFKSHER